MRGERVIELGNRMSSAIFRCAHGCPVYAELLPRRLWRSFQCLLGQGVFVEKRAGDDGEIAGLEIERGHPAFVRAN